MGAAKTSDHIKINIKMPNPSQEISASSKPPNQDLKDMDVLCTSNIKIESQNSEYRLIKKPVITSKSRSRCETPVRDIQPPPKSQIRAKRTWMFFAPSKSR